MKIVSIFLTIIFFIAICSPPISLIWVTGQGSQMPITGVPAPGMESFDKIIPELMTKYNIPGGSVAVAKDGKLIFAHGYGYADVDTMQSVQPDSLFRIASISKPITAAAILKLVEEGKLSLDDKAFKILDIKPPEGKKIDPRIYDITIRQLLQHSGGWDRNKTYGFDPMFISDKAAKAVGAPSPASCETVIRYMLGQPLDFNPGTKYAYSNFGYCVLGRVIEKVTGQKYENYVKNLALAPMGITEMRLGRTLLKDKAPKEVHYYDYPRAQLVQSVFPQEKQLVLWPYGGFYIEAMDAHGGWIASSIDLVRFAVSIDGQRPPAFLEKETVKLMLAPPDFSVGKSWWYGMGWNVEPIEGDTSTWSHDGALPGTMTALVRKYNGLSWAAVFNSRPEQYNAFLDELHRSIWKASEKVTSWPSRDLFKTVTAKTPTPTKTSQPVTAPPTQSPTPVPTTLPTTTTSAPTIVPPTSAPITTESPTQKSTGIPIFALYLSIVFFFMRKTKN